MANPSTLTTGDSLHPEPIVDSAGVVAFKRSYVRHTIAGATADGGHQGVAIVPAEVQAFGTAANGTVTCALPAVSGKVNYLSGILVTGGGATAAALVTATVTGLAGGTMRLLIAVPAGTVAQITPLAPVFTNPLAASAGSVAITLTVPPFGSGNTLVSAAIWGYVSA